MLENSERSVRGVGMGNSGPLERAELANQIEGFRIPYRRYASKKNNILYFFPSEHGNESCNLIGS